MSARELAEKLAQRLRNAWDPDRNVQLAFEGDLGSLNERQGFALALALNELITNAFRHGFPEGRTGTLTLHLEQDGQSCMVVVADPTTSFLGSSG